MITATFSLVTIFSFCVLFIEKRLTKSETGPASYKYAQFTTVSLTRFKTRALYN